jgi:ATP-dependent Zn protease
MITTLLILLLSYVSMISSLILDQHLFTVVKRKKMALHESGHCVAIWSCPFVNKIDFVSINLDAEDLAKVGDEFLDTIKLGYGLNLYYIDRSNTPDLLWSKMAISLAGIAGEASMYGIQISKTSELDLKSARADAIKLIKQQSFNPWWDVQYKGVLHPYQMLGADEQQAKLMEQAEATARDIIASYGDRFHKLVDLLIKKVRIDEDDIAKVLGDRINVINNGWCFLMPNEPRRSENGLE